MRNGTNVWRNGFIIKLSKGKRGFAVESVISAIIAGGLALIGTVITVSSGQKKTEQRLQTAQAVTDCKIDELTREVRLHNNFAQRVPVMEEQIKVINHRIADLEEGGK